MSAWASAIEPILAPFSIMVGAPDYKVAAVSMMCWLFAGASVIFIVMHRADIRSHHVLLLNGAIFGISSVLLFVLYLFFAVLIPLPSWSLTLDDPTAIVADLHSHTIASHDGLVTAAQSLAMHRNRGFSAVAWTEHYSPKWQTSFAASARTRGSVPEAIPGVEKGITIGGDTYYLLLLGIRPEVPLERWWPRLSNHRALQDFIAMIHTTEHGAVLAMNIDLGQKDINRLIDDGVDGFEIANFGHPRIERSVLRALINAQRSHHVDLVADSDWHGWGGHFKTWTVIKVDRTVESVADAAINALRNHDSDRIVPVVSQIFGAPSVFRSVFSPFVEIARYGGELSPLRLIFWWVWVALLIAANFLFRRLRLRSAHIFVSAILLILGMGLLFRGVQIMSLWSHDHSLDFPLFIGALGTGAGAIGFLLACWFASRATA